MLDPATLLIVLNAVTLAVGRFSGHVSHFRPTHLDSTPSGIEAIREMARLLDENKDILTQREHDILFKYVRWGLDKHDQLPTRNALIRPFSAIRFNVKARRLLNYAARVTADAVTRDYHSGSHGITELDISTSIHFESCGAAPVGFVGRIFRKGSRWARGSERRDQGNGSSSHQQGEVILQCEEQTSSWKTDSKIRATIKVQSLTGSNSVLQVRIAGWRLGPEVLGAEVKVQFRLDVGAFRLPSSSLANEAASPNNIDRTDGLENAATGASYGQSIVDALGHNFEVLASGVDDAVNGIM